MNQESGRSMIEMLGVLAIMGVITVGAIGMISTAMRTQKLTTVNDEVVQMVTMVRNIHAEYDDFSNMSTTRKYKTIYLEEKVVTNGLTETFVVYFVEPVTVNILNFKQLKEKKNTY